MCEIFYYVLLKATEATIAICSNEEAAKWIVANYPQECILRFVIK